MSTDFLKGPLSFEKRSKNYSSKISPGFFFKRHITIDPRSDKKVKEKEIFVTKMNL